MRCALLFVLGGWAVAQAADISVPGGVLRAERNSQVRMTGDQVELAGGTITFQVQDPDAARVEILTPSVSMRAYAEGVYRITVRKTGESEITAQSGRTLVVAPAGEQWLEEGQKMIARGPRANPQYRIVTAVAWWRRLASLLQNIQIGGGVGGEAESGGGGKETQAATAKETRSKPNENAAVSTGSAHANTDRARTSDSHSTTPSGSAHSGESRSTSSGGGGSASHASESHSAPASSSSSGSHSDTATRGK